MGRLKCQALSRSVIEPIHDVVYLCLGQRIQSRAFGHILANQPVGVLVESPFPSMIGMGKIYSRVQRLADRGMVGKLLAVIGCNRLGMALMGASNAMVVAATCSACLEETLPSTV